MNYGGDAAEQVVRMSLEGVEVAARLPVPEQRTLQSCLQQFLRKNRKQKARPDSQIC